MIQGEKSPLTNLIFNFLICKIEYKVSTSLRWQVHMSMSSKHTLIIVNCFIMHEKMGGTAETMLYDHQILLYFVFLPGHTGRPLFSSFPRE